MDVAEEAGEEHEVVEIPGAWGIGGLVQGIEEEPELGAEPLAAEGGGGELFEGQGWGSAKEVLEGVVALVGLPGVVEGGLLLVVEEGVGLLGLNVFELDGGEGELVDEEGFEFGARGGMVGDDAEAVGESGGLAFGEEGGVEGGEAVFEGVLPGGGLAFG